MLSKSVCCELKKVETSVVDALAQDTYVKIYNFWKFEYKMFSQLAFVIASIIVSFMLFTVQIFSFLNKESFNVLVLFFAVFYSL